MTKQELKSAIKAIKLAESSLHPGKSPRFTPENIEKVRKETSDGLLLAIKLLEEASK
jgi:hypothetical protein